MIVFLSKFLPLLVLPLGITLIMLLVGILNRRRWILIAAALFLWITSTPLVGNSLSQAMDAGQIRIPAADALTADAIVVLSTGRAVAPGPAAISEWDDADRFFGGVELFRAGKAPLLVFTGGWFPYSPTAPLEGEILAEYAKAMGVPSDRVLTTGRVVNTLEESRATAALFKERALPVSRILLVTSAFHMSRARLLFERAGFAVVPYPVDFGASRAAALGFLDVVPTAAALLRTQTAMRELYGQLAYRIVRVS
jgi:uncharacterized SAM-binding protein YcdF (DUF218 family)